MSENISFFNCAQVSWEDHLSVKPVAVVEETIITVKETAKTAYKYMEKAARRFTRWITVTAEGFRCAVTRRIRAFVRSVVCTSGVQILRKYMILRF